MTDETTGHRQRLRQRFLDGDAQALSDEALLELALTYAIPRKDVQPVTHHVMTVFGSLCDVLRADPASLRAIEGVGDNVVILLQLIGWIAAHRFGRSAVGAVDGVLPNGQPHPLPEVNPGQTTHPPGSTPENAPPVPASALAPDPGWPTDARLVDQEAGHEAVTLEAATPEAARDSGDQDSNRTGGADEPRWRARGPYTAVNASKAGLVVESRLALLAYERLGGWAAVRRELLDGGLPQRSRVTRETIVKVLADRLSAWDPPAWICSDLVAAASRPDDQDLCFLLLLHTARQDALLYDVVQEVIWPRWSDGLAALGRADVQRFLDGALSAHPEIDRWSVATREKLAGNLLTILRDYGLLQSPRGSVTKRITEPVVSPWVASHLARLLRDEGVAGTELAEHPDWRLWLLDVEHTRALLARVAQEEPAL